MGNGLKEIFEKLIDDYDEEQENPELCRQKQQERKIEKIIDEKYFKFTVPSILDTKQQEE